jgi:uncharacterized protein (TIGR02246 family)
LLSIISASIFAMAAKLKSQKETIMDDHALKREIAKADKAINERDFDTVASCYTEEAVLVVKPDKLVQGREAIKEAHQKISDYFKDSLNVSQGDMVIIEAGDIALVLSKTYIESPKKLDSEFSSEREAIYVYKKSGDGKWLCAIDNSYGIELLKTNP